MKRIFHAMNISWKTRPCLEDPLNGSATGITPRRPLASRRVCLKRLQDAIPSHPGWKTMSYNNNELDTNLATGDPKITWWYFEFVLISFWCLFYFCQVFFCWCHFFFQAKNSEGLHWRPNLCFATAWPREIPMVSRLHYPGPNLDSSQLLHVITRIEVCLATVCLL